jgi:hypothetical protein
MELKSRYQQLDKSGKLQKYLKKKRKKTAGKEKKLLPRTRRMADEDQE